MDWDDLRVFEAVASLPTLTASARRLNISVATVTRRIEALEAALDLRLVERTPEGVRLTPDGEALADQTRTAAAAINDVHRRADALRHGAAHPIRISATEPIAAELLAPHVPGLLRGVPDLRVEITVSTEIVSLASRRADIALRLARPQGASLLVQRLPPFRLGLYATGDYLGNRDPAAIDLRRERLLAYDDSYGPIAEVAWLEASGLIEAARIRSSSTRFLLNATLSGAGIGMLPEIFARRHAALTLVPTPTPAPDRQIWLMSHKDLKRSPRHRAVRAWILKTLHDASRDGGGS